MWVIAGLMISGGAGRSVEIVDLLNSHGYQVTDIPQVLSKNTQVLQHRRDNRSFSNIINYCNRMEDSSVEVLVVRHLV